MDNELSTIKNILNESKVLAVVGLSPKENRASHGVSKYLQSQGYKIIPVYPREEEILGEKVYRSLSDIDKEVDTVVIFRDPKYVVPIVEEAAKINAKTVWMQEGVINQQAYNIAKEKGMNVIMDRCMLKEHKKHM
ncbi:MAG: CoA-binding protein [Spirochaetota bacterium]